MIFGNIHNIGFEGIYPPAILRVLRYIKEVESEKGGFEKMELGKHVIDSDNLFFMLSEVETNDRENNKPESHKKYVDVQYLIRGVEHIGVATDMSNTGMSKFDENKLEVAEDLLSVKDMMLYKDCKNESFLTMIPGSFAVFFPTDIHRPALNDAMLTGGVKGERKPIRKIIFKVALSTL